MNDLKKRVDALMPEVDGVKPTIFQVQTTDDVGWCVKPVPGQIVADVPSREIGQTIADCMNEALRDPSYREILEVIRDAASGHLLSSVEILKAIEDTASNALARPSNQRHGWVEGEIVLVWDSGSKVRAPGRMHTRTGEVQCTAPASSEDPGSLEEEYFEAHDGHVFSICTNCHEYILRHIMVEDNVGDGLHEDVECAGHCEED